MRSAPTKVLLHLLVSSVLSTAARADEAAAQLEHVEAFKRFDTSGNGYLSGTEIDACGCRTLDGDGDNRITALEYLSGRGALPGGGRTAPSAAPPPRPAPAPAPVSPPAPAQAAAPVAPGTRVRAGCWGSMKVGTIERTGPDGRVWVHFEEDDGCDGWREAERLEAAPPEPGRRGGAFATGAPVEALSLGRWHSAVVLATEGQRVRVHFENYASSADEWVPADRVRQTPERARHRTGSGGAVPSGRYACHAFSTGAGLRYQSEFTVTGDGTYRDIDGQRGRFAKDTQGVVRFDGGAFGGSQGEFQYNAGRAMIYMHTPSKPGTRAGMDCEGPRP